MPGSARGEQGCRSARTAGAGRGPAPGADAARSPVGARRRARAPAAGGHAAPAPAARPPARPAGRRTGGRRRTRTRRRRGRGASPAGRPCSAWSCWSAAAGLRVSGPRLPRPAGPDRRAGAAQAAPAAQRIAELAERAAKWDDPEYVRSQARQRLYYGPAGREALRRGRPGAAASDATPSARPGAPKAAAPLVRHSCGRSVERGRLSMTRKSRRRAPRTTSRWSPPSSAARPRGTRAVAHRCPCGLPDVVETTPRLADGTPFPTLFYLTCPRAAARVQPAGVRRADAGDGGPARRGPRAGRGLPAAHEDYLRPPRGGRRTSRRSPASRPAACPTG